MANVAYSDGEALFIDSLPDGAGYPSDFFNDGGGVSSDYDRWLDEYEDKVDDYMIDAGFLGWDSSVGAYRFLEPDECDSVSGVYNGSDPQFEDCRCIDSAREEYDRIFERALAECPIYSTGDSDE